MSVENSPPSGVDPLRPERYRQVRGENAAYRAGVVLGLTLGEIILLLLFALLLIIGATRQWAVRETDTLNKRVADLENKLEAYAAIEKEGGAGAVVRLQAELRRLSPLEAHHKIYEDIQRAMRRLPPDKQTPQAIAEQLVALADIQEKSGGLKAEELITAVQFTRDAAAIAPGMGPREILQEMRASAALKKEFPDRSISQVYEAARAWEESTKSLTLQSGESPRDGLQRMVRENANLRGQNMELSKRIAAEKKGNMFPSCWATPDGKEEAIFDVTYNEAGIEVVTRPLPHRDADRDILPLKNVRFERMLSAGEFRADLMALYRWSVSENCRFHVVLYARGRIDRNQQNAVNAFFYPASSIQSRD